MNSVTITDGSNGYAFCGITSKYPVTTNKIHFIGVRLTGSTQNKIGVYALTGKDLTSVIGTTPNIVIPSTEQHLTYEPTGNVYPTALVYDNTDSFSVSALWYE